MDTSAMTFVTDETFDEVVGKSALPVLFVMGATWCPDCQRIAPLMMMLPLLLMGMEWGRGIMYFCQPANLVHFVRLATLQRTVFSRKKLERKKHFALRWQDCVGRLRTSLGRQRSSLLQPATLVCSFPPRQPTGLNFSTHLPAPFILTIHSFFSFDYKKKKIVMLICIVCGKCGN